MIKICKHCGVDFNINTPEKRRVGGLINECPDCVEERGGDTSPPIYLGVAAGNGKMSDITILEFPSEDARKLYQRAWKNNSGQNKGKSCQLGGHLTPMSGMGFHIVGENRSNDNHKGKA